MIEVAAYDPPTSPAGAVPAAIRVRRAGRLLGSRPRRRDAVAGSAATAALAPGGSRPGRTESRWADGRC